jgi:hypothetical protein
MRGLKMGSMRVGVGFTSYPGLAYFLGGAEERQLSPTRPGWTTALQNQTAASAREKKRSRRRKPSSIRSMDVA